MKLPEQILVFSFSGDYNENRKRGEEALERSFFTLLSSLLLSSLSRSRF